MDVGIISEVLASNLRTGIGIYTSNLTNELNLINGATNYHFINFISDKQSSNEITIPNKIPFFKRFPWYLTLPISLKNVNLDVIHNPTGIPTYFKFKQKYVFTVHDLTPLLLPRSHPNGVSLYYKAFFPRTVLTADKIIADSKNTKKDLIEYFHIPSDNVEVIYIAASSHFKPQPVEEIQRVKEKYQIHFPYILYVGTLEPRKNIATLIRAFSEIIKNKKDLKLVIAGIKGWKYSGIFHLVDNLRLNKHILFTGYLDYQDLPALYSGAKVFVYPSLYEGFGLPPLEAMSCGCPVITSNSSSLPEVVGNAGILIDPTNYHRLKDCMLEVINDENIYNSLRKKGLERAKSFSWKECAKGTLEVYRAAMEAKE